MLYAMAGGFFAFALGFPRERVLSVVFPLVGLLTLILASAFHHLTVADEGDRLAIRFGPLPLFRRSVAYADIVSAEVGRTTVLDGWGIHLSLRGGWVWNLWGRDCVVLRLRKGTLRIGTDDAQALACFVQSRIGDAPAKPDGADHGRG